MTRVLKGHLIALFAFDIGYEVSLERLSSLVAAAPIQPLSRRRQTPTYLQYTRAPVILDLDTHEELGGVQASLQVTIFDFGALSVAYRWPLSVDDAGLPLSNLPAISAEIYHRNLETQARDEVIRLSERIASAIDRPKLSGLVEDYYLFIIEQLDPHLRAEELLVQHRGDLAQSLSFETLPLSKWQQEEVLSQTISYLDSDLTIVDWNAAIIYDRDFDDTAKVLELLNVELLEARYIDDTLDKRVTAYAGFVHKPASWPIPLRTPYRKVLQELTEWRIESTVLSERVGNSLKLIGDLYLSRIHSAASAKTHLPEWERIISHKLQILDELYDRVNDRIRAAQSQALELIIVALIVFEVLLALFRH
ncbi:MAG TPA: hypothetical protein VJ180_02345 [Pyrinomonadaceae bacterium]|nr:hypothetical protein [Pyrinomonadaceae bacterium]